MPLQAHMRKGHGLPLRSLAFHTITRCVTHAGKDAKAVVAKVPMLQHCAQYLLSIVEDDWDYSWSGM